MPAPGVIRDALLTIEATDYAGKVKTARFVPETEVQSYPTLVPTGTLTSVGNPIWSLELEGVQDHTTGGLAKLLTESHGQEIEVVLAPFDEVGERQVTATVIAQAVPFGGESGTFADFSVTLGVVGEPTFADVAA
jgi:hypothetical protein